MTRTRRRPLPAHQVDPERAVVFGLALGVLSFVVMVWFVNLTAAFLTLLAIGFYVVVYTMLLKRSTPQNIVIGGAAGALPPVIGWAAVTGQRRPARRCSCSCSSSTGRRRISGRCRCGSARTTPRPACRCCPSSRASPRRPARSRCTRSSWSRSRWCSSPSARMGAIYLGRGGRPRGDLPVAGVRPVAARRLRGGLDRRRDPALQVLDQLPEPAVPRGRDRRAGADPALSAVAEREPRRQVGQQRLGGERAAEEGLQQVRRAAGTPRPRTARPPRTDTSPGRPRTTGPRTSRDPGPDRGRHDRRQGVVGEVARAVDELAADGPPRPLGVRLDRRGRRRSPRSRRRSGGARGGGGARSRRAPSRRRA